MKTASALPFASNVRSPEEIANEDVDLYSPGVSVRPPMLPDNVTISVEVLPARSLYAAVRSSLAWLEEASLMCCVPFRIPGGNPPIEEPGLSPMSPVIFVAPVLVIEDPASTAIGAVAPSDTEVWVVVCTGITTGLFLEGEGSLLLHAPKKTAVEIANADISFVVFILLYLNHKKLSWRYKNENLMAG
jgi:hypothetical protein